jgi:hypothetical protein
VLIPATGAGIQARNLATRLWPVGAAASWLRRRLAPGRWGTSNLVTMIGPWARPQTGCETHGSGTNAPLGTRIELLSRHGLPRDDLDIDAIAYAFQATFEGVPARGGGRRDADDRRPRLRPV